MSVASLPVAAPRLAAVAVSGPDVPVAVRPAAGRVRGTSVQPVLGAGANRKEAAWSG